MDRKIILYSILMLAMAFNISCGRNLSDEGSISQASYNDREGDSQDTSNYKLRNCVQFSHGQNAANFLQGKVKAFENAVGAIDYRYLRLRFTNIPSNFSADNVVIRFFRGIQQIGDDVQTFQQSFHGQQLSFDVERAENHIASLISFDNLDLQNNTAILGGYDLTDINIVLNFDILAVGYQALQIVIYEKVVEDRDLDGTPETYLEARNNAIVLAPPFIASPDMYADKLSGKDILISLHPEYHNSNLGISEQEFVDRAQGSCY